MRSYILICNTNNFNIKKAFMELDKITWPQLEGAAVGDAVYIYATNPCRAILYRCEIEEINLHKMDKETIAYVTSPLFYEAEQIYMRMSRMQEYPEDLFKDEELKNHGFLNFQSSSIMSNELADYLQKKEKTDLVKRRKNNANLIAVAGIILTVFAVVGTVVMFKPDERNKVEEQTTVENRIQEKADEKDSWNSEKESQETVQELQNASADLNTIEFNEFFLNFKGLTYGEYKENTGKEAQWIRGEVYEAELSGSRLSIVFQSSPPALNGDEVEYLLYDEDKSHRVQGLVSDFLIWKNTDVNEGIHYLELVEHCAENVKLVDVKVGNYSGAYTISDNYAVYLFEFDDKEGTQVELHIDMTDATDGIIKGGALAWIVFCYDELDDFSSFEMVSESIHADVTANYGNNLNPYDYQYYKSLSFDEFNFYYPSYLYNAVNMATKRNSDEYGAIMEEIVFTGSDNSSKAIFQLKKRENVRTVAEETQKLYDYYKNNILGFQRIIFSNEDVTKPGRMVIAGFDSVQQVMVYLLVTVTEKHIMTMKISFPTDGNRETEDFKEKEYFVECMYRLCGFSGSTYEVRTYEQFLNGEVGKKK